MDELLLHKQTRDTLEQLLHSQPHAILLLGNEGAGKLHIAQTLASRILDAPHDSYPHFIHIKPETKSITIEQIRDLQTRMKLKTTGRAQIRRIAVLQDAHTMTIESQNALLKLLEEPPVDTMLILTAQGAKSLKPTIYSRVQSVSVKPVTKGEAQVFLGNDVSVDKIYELSNGDVGLLIALLNKDDQHPLIDAISRAKVIFGQTQFERIAKIDELAKDKLNLEILITAMKRIAKAARRAAVLKNDTKNVMRWTDILEKLYASEQKLSANVNTKLLLTNLFLEF